MPEQGHHNDAAGPGRVRFGLDGSMAQQYREGDWFAVPLPRGGYAVGLVARRPRRGTVVLGYFFGPPRKTLPACEALAGTRAEHALLVCRVKDTALHNGEWRVLGRPASWRREDWPIPAFHRREGLSGRGIRVEYDDEDLTTPARESVAGAADASLAMDVVHDDARLLEVLARLLSEKWPVIPDPTAWIR